MGTITKTKVYIDGISLPILQAFNWSHPPGPVVEMTPTLTDAYERMIPIKYNYAEGDCEVISKVDGNTNDPLDTMEMLGFVSRYAYFDTTTETVKHSSTVYSFLDEESGNLGVPTIPIELRQLESGVTDTISTGAGENDMIAVRFKAAGEDIHKVIILCEDVTGSEVTSVELQVWSDGTNEPGSLIASTNTPTIAVTVPSDTEDYLEISDLEEGATNDLLDGEELTVGTWYWLVINADDADVLTLHGTTNQRYTGSDVMVSDDGGTTWSAAANSMENLVFALQFYQTKGGHTVEVYEYDEGEDNYIKSTCQASDVRIDTETYGSQKATRVKFKFKSNYAYTTKVTS